MKLFYYRTRSPSANFGDELNLWLWPRLLPPFDGDVRNVFVGIGTILNDDLPESLSAASRIIFFSTGVGYGNQFRLKMRENWKIYCLRGPLSAKRLNLQRSVAITDGAALLKKFFAPLPVEKRSHNVSYMPHFRHGSPALLKAVCQLAGLHFIDPSSPAETVIAEIARSRLILSEAMHGTIVADTLRVPWIPVCSSPKILPFKWQDWCASVKVPYRPKIIKGAQRLSLADYRYPLKLWLQRQSSLRHFCSGLSMNRLRTCSTADVVQQLAEQIVAIAKTSSYLSDTEHLESLVARLEERLVVLREDIHQGVFS